MPLARESLLVVGDCSGLTDHGMRRGAETSDALGS